MSDVTKTRTVRPQEISFGRVSMLDDEGVEVLPALILVVDDTEITVLLDVEMSHKLGHLMTGAGCAPV
jgi:hypothetical protein